MQQREVARPTTKVADQDQFVMVERRLIRIRRGDRLHLEGNRFKSGMKKRLPQPLDSKIIVLHILGPDETDRATNRGMTNRLIELPLCIQSQIRQNARD